METLNDLKPGMVLEGAVTNVAAFGAFVDIGVHQDGLVHISEITDTFIKHPSEVLKVGEIVKVRVLGVEVDSLGTSTVEYGAAETPPFKHLPPTALQPGRTASSPFTSLQCPGRPPPCTELCSTC